MVRPRMETETEALRIETEAVACRPVKVQNVNQQTVSKSVNQKNSKNSKIPKFKLRFLSKTPKLQIVIWEWTPIKSSKPWECVEMKNKKTENRKQQKTENNSTNQQISCAK